MNGQENAKRPGRCVIFGGADIGDYEYIKGKLAKDDFLIFCDSGLKHMQALDLKPDLIVGDFDSHENPHLDVETIVLPCEKDDTDTVFAVKEAVKRGYGDFLLLGVVGARLDHTLGNVYILEYLNGLGKRAVIIDDYSEMELVTPGNPTNIGEESEFFSLINISGLAGGITITGAKYPLSNAEIKSEYQYGVSNEVLPGQTAKVSVNEGSLLLIKIRRK
ncbi:MAG: thiamine diphosphokinase [Butyrivibrio sp.]|nr:thiamine diphosphokinase [Butyrivibrio sp.]